MAGGSGGALSRWNTCMTFFHCFSFLQLMRLVGRVFIPPAHELTYFFFSYPCVFICYLYSFLHGLLAALYALPRQTKNSSETVRGQLRAPYIQYNLAVTLQGKCCIRQVVAVSTLSVVVPAKQGIGYSRDRYATADLLQFARINIYILVCTIPYTLPQPKL